MKIDQAISEIISAILAVILVIALACIVGAIFLGWAVPLQKTAYIVTDATPVTISGASVVQVFMSQGETVSLAPAPGPGLPVKFSLTNGSATYNFVPLPGAASAGWKPGTSLILFRNASGSWVTDSTASVQNNIGFSNGTWTVNIIDVNSKALIAQHTVTLTGGGASPPVSPPATNFSGSPLTGNVPLAVQFTDTSTGTPTAWSWNFGDGNTSTAQSPLHTYTSPVTYTVSLTATNGGGSNTTNKIGYITATEPGFTAEAWVIWTKDPYPISDDQKWATIVVDGNDDSNRVYVIAHDKFNTKFQFRIKTISTTANPYGGNLESDNPPYIGVWYHVAEVYNQTPGTFQIYVNGDKQIATGTWSPDSSGMHSSPGHYQVGGPSGITYSPGLNQRKFDGEIRGLKTYQEGALSPEQIRAHYQAGVPPA